MRVLSLLLLLAVSTCGMSPAFAGDLPDATLTPGLANPDLTKERICAPGFTTRTVRNVPAALKREIYARYGMENHKGACAGKEGCEIDHLIPLTAGGANDKLNLWVQPYRGEWSAHVKDKLENQMRRLVCSSARDLADWQAEIATDWKAMFKRCIGDSPASKARAKCD